MAKRAIVGVIYCIVLYFAARYVVGEVASNLATVEAGQDAVAVRSQAAQDAEEKSRHIIAFVVVGLVFLGSRLGFLPGTRVN